MKTDVQCLRRTREDPEPTVSEQLSCFETGAMWRRQKNRVVSCRLKMMYMHTFTIQQMPQKHFLTRMIKL